MNEITMKKPMTTEEFFSKICDILKEKGLMPAILDYALPTFHPTPIITYEFGLETRLAYGESEGIYLDIGLKYYKDGREHIVDGGTFKTLCESREAMYTMAALLADFTVEEWNYVNQNLDNFNWEGADVYAVSDAGERLDCRYSCRSMEAALKRKGALLVKYPRVAVRDNATRKETVYFMEENE